MDKNVLQEYQKRVEQWANDSEQRPIKLQERIAREQTELQDRIASQERELQEQIASQESELQERIASQHRELQNRIEPEQNKLTEIISANEAELMELQGPANMDDVTYTESLGKRVVATKREEYSQDEEGKLLREFDIAVNDSAVTRAEIDQVIEALRKERERIRQERRDVLNKEIQDAKSRQAELEAELREGQESIRAEVAEGVEKITLEAKEGQERIDLEAKEGQERIALEEQKGQEENAREAEATKNQLTDELQEAKREIEAKIQRKKENISRKMSEFDEAFKEGSIHKQTLTLYKDTESKVYTAAKSELEKCERVAKSAQTRVKRLTREISHLEQDLGQIDGLLGKLSNSREVDEISRQEDEMWEAYRAEQEEKRDREVDEGLEAQQLEEKQEEARVAEETAEQVEQYADGLNPEEPTEPEKPEEPVKPNPVPPTTGPKPQTPATQQPQPKSKGWKVESVAFTIEGGNNPVYKVIVSNGKVQKEVTSTEIAVLDEDFDRDEIKTLTERKGIFKAEKCYDKGLATLLEQIDGEYGTESLKEYQRLLKDREMIHRYPEKYKDCIQIEYDFSELTGKVSKEMKQLQKIAKECETKGVVAYQKRPNIFQRIWRKLANETRLLKATPLEPNMSEKDLKTISTIQEMKESREDRPYELDIDALKEYPEFSPEVAKEQLEETMETVEEKVHLDDVIDAAKAWRKAQHIETPVVKPEDLEQDNENGNKKHEKEIGM